MPEQPEQGTVAGYLPVQGARTPIPDPTALTDAAIARSTAQFRREMDALRELLAERISTEVSAREEAVRANAAMSERRIADLDKSLDRRMSLIAQVPGELRAEWERNLGAMRDVLETRLHAIDKATELLASDVSRTPTVVQTAITGVREVYDERFSSIAQQFTERDIRTEQAATAAASALAAALQAAKEAVFEQSQAAARASEKTELLFTRQIDQIQLQIKAIGDGFSDRIAELKERIDRGEGAGSGAAGQRNETRLNLGSLVSVALLVISVVTFVILYVAKK